MLHKTIQSFSQCTYILKGLVVLVLRVGTYFQKQKKKSDENITAPTASDYRLNPQLTYLGNKIRIEIRGNCFKQDEIIHSPEKVVNIYLAYEISKKLGSYSTLKNYLFAAVSLTKNADIDKCKFSGYGIEFGGHGLFSHPSGGTGRNVIIFAVDMISSRKIDNKKKDILILGKAPTQGLEETLSAEKMY